jgi:hypothetical protein
MKNYLQKLLFAFVSVSILSCSDEGSSIASNTFKINNIPYALSPEQSMMYQNQLIVGTNLIRTVFTISGIANDGKIGVVSFDLYRTSEQSLSGNYTFIDDFSSFNDIESQIASLGKVSIRETCLAVVSNIDDLSQTTYNAPMADSVSFINNGSGNYTVIFNGNFFSLNLENPEQSTPVPVQLNVTSDTN